jgi:hypothetical protein
MLWRVLGVEGQLLEVWRAAWEYPGGIIASKEAPSTVQRFYFESQ